jgi:hypothetical protein
VVLTAGSAVLAAVVGLAALGVAVETRDGDGLEAVLLPGLAAAAGGAAAAQIAAGGRSWRISEERARSGGTSTRPSRTAATFR